jgi:membrane-associated phospholipid phosphatase
VTDETSLAIRPADWRSEVLRRLDPMAAELRAWLVSLVVCGCLVATCYGLVDRPVAHFFMLGDEYNPLISLLHRLPDLMPVAVVCFGITIPVLVWVDRSFRLARGVGIAAVSCALAMGAKNLGKFVFGRTWPETWGYGGSSYLRDGVYGMFPFHGGRGYGSFPSGHMCATMAVVMVAWVLWPRLRLLWGAIAAAMAGLLIGFNFHFVSDVIAGAWLGTACAVITLKMVQRMWPGWV